MAIYSWLCQCGQISETTQGISAYCNPDTKIVPRHCDRPMERMLTVNGQNDALANALAGDRHYDTIMAPDGVTRLDTRSKHQEYMRRHNLTIADDFKGEWAAAAKQRAERLQGAGDSRARKQILDREFTKRERQ